MSTKSTSSDGTKRLSVKNTRDDLVFLGEAMARIEEGRPVVTLYGDDGEITLVFGHMSSNDVDDIMGLYFDVRENDCGPSSVIMTLIGVSSYRSEITKSFRDMLRIIHVPELSNG